jgi:hypothetical protein
VTVAREFTKTLHYEREHRGEDFLPRMGASMKRKTVYLNGTPLGTAQTWHEVSALIGHMTVRHIRNHGNEGPDGFYVILESEGVADAQSLRDE